MRTKISNVVVMLILAQMCCYGVHGQGRFSKSRILLEDPMFGLTYDYTKVNYEQMPISIRHICPDYEHGTFWTFAHTKRKSGDYFVVMGVRPGQDGDSLGAALVIKDSKCYEEDSTWMLSGFIPEGGYSPGKSARKLPGLDAPKICEGSLGPCHYVFQSKEEEEILRDLVKDALVRGVQAWGGTDRFKNEVCKASHQKVNADMPVVQQELKVFCNINH
jgi:hypothetical protein